MIDVSVIIPCYNHGLYIQEAIDSVMEVKGCQIEIVIVDDGSNDLLTIEKLDELTQNGYKVLRKSNSGPASSRNAGIAVSRGKYILPLDADNKIKKEYLVNGLRILNTSDSDIVYGNPIFFGEPVKEKRFVPKPFNGDDLFIHNYIDTCAMYRKEVWEELGGYDTSIPFYGNEDWEFWLHAYIKGYKFTFLNESLYYYRILLTSLISSAGKDYHSINREYILKKHFGAFSETMTAKYNYSKMYERDLNNPLRSSAKYLLRFLKKSIVAKNE